ncbi:MAG: hypothetical protein AB1651_07615 [Pseudomonadota bacterium]
MLHSTLFAGTVLALGVLAATRALPYDWPADVDISVGGAGGRRERQ